MLALAPAFLWTFSLLIWSCYSVVSPLHAEQLHSTYLLV